MISLTGLFEAHLTVSDLTRAMDFYGGVLGLELAHTFPARDVAFYWIGEAGRSMIGLWGTGTGPQRMSLHVAFSTTLAEVLDAPKRLEAAGVVPRDFWGVPTQEPVVLGWVPAAAVYFTDPDGHLLEFLAMLPDRPSPDLGVVSWSVWLTRDSGA